MQMKNGNFLNIINNYLTYFVLLYFYVGIFFGFIFMFILMKAMVFTIAGIQMLGGSAAAEALLSNTSKTTPTTTLSASDYVEQQSWHKKAQSFSDLISSDIHLIERQCSDYEQKIQKHAKDKSKFQKLINSIHKQIDHVKKFMAYIQSSLYQNPYAKEVMVSTESQKDEDKKWMDKDAFLEIQKSTLKSEIANLKNVCSLR